MKRYIYSKRCLYVKSCIIQNRCIFSLKGCVTCVQTSLFMNRHFIFYKYSTLLQIQNMFWNITLLLEIVFKVCCILGVIYYSTLQYTKYGEGKQNLKRQVSIHVSNLSICFCSFASILLKKKNSNSLLLQNHFLLVSKRGKSGLGVHESRSFFLSNKT